MLSNAGRWLLDRREFLRTGGTGLSGLALLALMAQEQARDDDPKPIRPEWNAQRPVAARPPHFRPRAKNVLVIFCSGACSQLETWDYKPELVKRDGQPMPGGDGLVTFQGENGNLARPLWDFKPRGESGKMISDMLPNLAELAAPSCTPELPLPASVVTVPSALTRRTR
jgi:hypothetical protein